MNATAGFPLASALRGGGVPIGDVFSFLSGLYFRGKLSYARAFGLHSEAVPGVFVITTNRGLLPPEAPVTLEDLESFATIDIAGGGEGFRDPLRRDAERLRGQIDPDRGVVDLQTLHVLKRTRDDVPSSEPLPLGVWAEVIQPGDIRIGDAVSPG